MKKVEDSGKSGMTVSSSRLKQQIDEAQKKRAGKQLNIAVSINKTDRNLNFHHAMLEIQKLLEMHELSPQEVFVIAGQLTSMASSAQVRFSCDQLASRLMDIKKRVDKLE